MVEREEDGRWWADIESMPGVMACGETRESAIAAVQALAVRVAADCIDHREDIQFRAFELLPILVIAFDQEIRAVKLTNLTYIILELNAALDTGKYDDIPMSDASEHIEAGDVIPWLKREVPEIDLSLLSVESANEYQSALADIYGGCAGNARRKWGVERRALCLLVAWTNELIQQRRWEAD